MIIKKEWKPTRFSVIVRATAFPLYVHFRVKEENRRLLQEKAENEQVIKLLETQKEVLAKSVRDTNLYLELFERARGGIDDI